MRFKCILVLYNINYHQSETFNDLVNTEYFHNNRIDIIVVDNSTADYQNSTVENNESIHYISMDGNVGLSKAYNRALNYITDKEGHLIVLLDDDTHITNQYFQEIEKAYINQNADIYLPVIYDQEGSLLSPSIMKKYRCLRAENLDEISDKNICGINTGMAIKGDIFSHYRYNENLFLDFVDHNFIRDMKEQKRKIVYVNTKLEQNFSLLEDDYESSLKRFKIAKKDIYEYYNHRGLISKCVYYYTIIRRKMKNYRQFKKIGIFFE